MNLAKSKLPVVSLSPLVVAIVCFTQIIHGQIVDVYQLRDFPRTADLESFRKKFSEQTKPADATSLFSEIQRLQYTRQRFDDIRDQLSRIDELKSQYESNIIKLERSVREAGPLCKEYKSANEVKSWWDGMFNYYGSIVTQGAQVVGTTYDPMRNPAPEVRSNESCQTYCGKLATVLDDVKKNVTDRLNQYQQIETEKLKNIPEVSAIYDARIDLLKRDLEASRQQKTATSIADNLWVMVLVLGGIAIIILLIVRLFPENTQLELVQSGQVIQFITVLLLLTVIMALGLSGIIKENTLGTLLGGLAGYVLSQGVGRAASHVAKTKEPAA